MRYAAVAFLVCTALGLSGAGAHPLQLTGPDLVTIVDNGPPNPATPGVCTTGQGDFNGALNAIQFCFSGQRGVEASGTLLTTEGAGFSYTGPPSVPVNPFFDPGGAFAGQMFVSSFGGDGQLQAFHLFAPPLQGGTIQLQIAVSGTVVFPTGAPGFASLELIYELAGASLVLPLSYQNLTGIPQTFMVAQSILSPRIQLVGQQNVSFATVNARFNVPAAFFFPSSIDYSVIRVDEPGTLVLLILGGALLMLIGLRRRRV
jgi:hypothetical protein